MENSHSLCHPFCFMTFSLIIFIFILFRHSRFSLFLSLLLAASEAHRLRYLLLSEKWWPIFYNARLKPSRYIFLLSDSCRTTAFPFAKVYIKLLTLLIFHAIFHSEIFCNLILSVNLMVCIMSFPLSFG